MVRVGKDMQRLPGEPAVVMAAVTKEEPVIVLEKVEKEVAQEIEAVLATAAEALTEEPSYVQAAAQTVVTPKPPAEDVSMETLMKAAASEDIKTDLVPENFAAVAEVSQKQDQVKVKVQKKKKAAPQKKKNVLVNRPAASPLARLLAEELGLDLTNLGKGSGKNGKILIDDVRKFQARMDKAKELMKGGAFFATASA